MSKSNLKCDVKYNSFIKNHESFEESHVDVFQVSGCKGPPQGDIHPLHVRHRHNKHPGERLVTTIMAGDMPPMPPGASAHVTLVS